MNWIPAEFVDALAATAGFAGTEAELADLLKRIEDLGCRRGAADPDRLRPSPRCTGSPSCWPDPWPDVLARCSESAVGSPTVCSCGWTGCRSRRRCCSPGRWRCASGRSCCPRPTAPPRRCASWRTRAASGSRPRRSSSWPRCCLTLGLPAILTLFDAPRLDARDGQRDRARVRLHRHRRLRDADGRSSGRWSSPTRCATRASRTRRPRPA